MIARNYIDIKVKARFRASKNGNAKIPSFDFYFYFFISAIYCMSQKIERPVLSGQRIKTRKRGLFFIHLFFDMFFFPPSANVYV